GAREKVDLGFGLAYMAAYMHVHTYLVKPVAHHGPAVFNRNPPESARSAGEAVYVRKRRGPAPLWDAGARPASRAQATVSCSRSGSSSACACDSATVGRTCAALGALRSSLRISRTAA